MEEELSAFSPYLHSQRKKKEKKSFSFSPLDPGTSTRIFDSLKRMKEDMSPTITKRKKTEESFNSETQEENGENELYSLIESQRENIEDLEKQLDSKEQRIQQLEIEVEEFEENQRSLSTHQVYLERELKQTQLYLEEERKRVDNLKRQLLSVSSNVESATNPEEMNALDKHRESTENEFSSLMEKNYQLEMALEDYKSSIDQLSSELEKTRFTHQHEKEELQAVVKELEEKMKSKSEQDKRDSQEQNEEQIDKLKSELSEAKKKNQEYEFLKQERDELKILCDHLKGEAENMKSLEREHEKILKENDFYKAIQQNVELLQEKNENLKEKLERAQKFQQKYEELLIEKESLEKKKTEFDSLISGLEEFDSPAHVQAVIDALRRENSVLLQKQGTLETTIKQKENTLQDSQSKLMELQQNFEELENKLSQLEDVCKIQEKKSVFFKKKADGLQAILDSYNEETTGNYDKQKEARLVELERMAVERENLISILQSKISPVGLEPSDSEKKIQESIEIQSLKTENSKLNKEIEKLVEEIAILESRVGKGEFDKRTTKVLHMAMNPHAEALSKKEAADLQSLQAENKKLKQQIQDLTQTDGRDEVRQELQKQIDDSMTKMNRLKEVFRKKIHEHREMVYQLFGYKLDNPSDKQYRLQSMYAENDKEFLLFQGTSGGDLDLLETDYTAKLGNQISTFLSKYHSIPVFLSNLTMERFNESLENTEEQ